MTDRVVKVSLIASANQLLSEMDKAAKKTRELGTETEKLASKKDAFDKLGKSAMALGSVLAVGVGLAVSRFADFDKAMSEVQASTHETVANMGSLRDAAIEAGATTVFTATEAANAINEMAKAGVSTADILNGGLNGALDLASAGSLEVADAAEIAATALTQFGLSGSQVPHIADLLAAGAGKAQGSVEDLSQALNQGGLVASQTGLTIEETTGALSAFASAGLIGSDAGTAFKTMLQRLTPQSAEARDKMRELGISAYDANGNFVGMAKFAGILKDALGGMSDEARNSALGVIFGSDAVRAASVIYSQGAEGVQEWIDKTNDSGYAAETARLKLDNLSGDVEKLGGSFDTALIKSGSGANDVLRDLVQAATGLIDGFNNLNPVAQGGVTVLAALTSGALLLGGGFLAIVPKVAAAKRAIQDLEITGTRVAKGIGKGGALLLALDGIAGGMTAMGAQSTLAADELAKVDAAAKGKNLKDLDALFHDANGNATTFNATLKTLFSGDFLQNGSWVQAVNGAVDAITFGLTDMTESVDHNKAALRELGSQLATTAQTDLRGAISGFKDYIAQTDGSKDSIQALLNAFPDYKAQLIALAGEQGKSLTAQELLNLAQGKGALAANLLRDADARAAAASAENAAALEGLSGAAQNTEVDIDSLADTIRGFGSAQFDVNSATRGFEAALDDLTQAVADNGATLDRGTEAGRANDAAVDDLAKSTLELAAATAHQTGKQEDANGVIAAGRKRLIEQLAQFGITGQAAEDYADRLGLIPDSVNTAVNANTANADMKLAATKALIDKLADKTITITTRMAGLNYSGYGGADYDPKTPYATGGYTGPGGKYQPAGIVHKGEWVFDQEKTRRYWSLFNYIQNGGRIPGYAGGGYVRGDRTQYVQTPGVVASPGQSGPGSFVGNLYLDSGELLGRVRGEVQAGIENYGRAQSQAIRGGVIR